MSSISSILSLIPIHFTLLLMLKRGSIMPSVFSFSHWVYVNGWQSYNTTRLPQGGVNEYCKSGLLSCLETACCEFHSGFPLLMVGGDVRWSFTGRQWESIRLFTISQKNSLILLLSSSKVWLTIIIHFIYNTHYIKQMCLQMISKLGVFFVVISLVYFPKGRAFTAI